MAKNKTGKLFWTRDELLKLRAKDLERQKRQYGEILFSHPLFSMFLPYSLVRSPIFDDMFQPRFSVVKNGKNFIAIRREFFCAGPLLEAERFCLNLGLQNLRYFVRGRQELDVGYRRVRVVLMKRRGWKRSRIAKKFSVTKETIKIDESKGVRLITRFYLTYGPKLFEILEGDNGKE